MKTSPLCIKRVKIQRSEINKPTRRLKDVKIKEATFVHNDLWLQGHFQKAFVIQFRNRRIVQHFLFNVLFADFKEFPYLRRVKRRFGKIFYDRWKETQFELIHDVKDWSPAVSSFDRAVFSDVIPQR